MAIASLNHPTNCCSPFSDGSSRPTLLLSDWRSARVAPQNLSIDMALNVTWQAFADISVMALYRALMLRQSVFVVEQNCAYLDADGLDEIAIHGLGHDQDGHLVAVARILPPGRKFALPSIGRIAVATASRRFGYGRAIVAAALAEVERRHSSSAIRIDAQAYLESFYGSFGFRRAGLPFDEDGIPHVAMIRDPIR